MDCDIVADILIYVQRLKRCILQLELFDQIDFCDTAKNIAAPVRASLRGGNKLCGSVPYLHHEKKWIPRI